MSRAAQNDIHHPILALAGMVLPVEAVGMNRFRLVFIIVAAGCLLRPAPLPAQEAAPPFAMDKPCSADLTITMKQGMTIHTKAYLDGDKMRSDMKMNGMDMTSIIRKDERKIYQVMVSQKMVLVMDYDPDKLKGYSVVDSAFGPEGKFELVGPDTVDGVACTKYKVTSDKSKQIFYFWLDVAASVPSSEQAHYAANRQMVGVHLTTDDIEALQVRASKWKSTHPH